MKLEAVTAEIRPRSDWEAVDLGLALVRRDFWRCITVWWLAVLPWAALSGWLLWDSPALWLMVFWWLKPLGSRLVLFEVSRRLFGEAPGWRTALAQIPRAWVRRFGYRMLWARFSPWQPVTMALEDLEGLRGEAYRSRCGQVTRRGESVIMWLYFAGDAAACWFGIAVLAMVGIFMPEGQDGAWQLAVDSWSREEPFDIAPLILRTVGCCVMVAMSLSDVFVTGAGFGLYINTRTWVEGWDVELALKRMAKRLGKAVIALATGFFLLGMPALPAAEPARPPEEVIREVKSHPDFKVHTVIEKVPKSKSFTPSRRIGDIGWLGDVFVAGVIAVLLGLLGWLVWANRHVFRKRGLLPGAVELRPRARVVMGMEITPESLPEDVPGAAWRLWQQGRHQEALGLLYRGTISSVVDIARVEIRESDTEGDCLRRVEQAGEAAMPDYFRSLTRMWMGMAYGGNSPRDADMELLCRSWPFVERRAA